MIVLDSTKLVVDRARHVSLDQQTIVNWARDFDSSNLRLHSENLFAHLPSSHSRLANLILLIDALNFCFWSDDPIRTKWSGITYHRYNAMLTSIIQVVRTEPRWCDAEYWCEASPDEINRLLVREGHLLLMEERVDTVHETGRTLLDRFDGQFVNAIDSVNSQAWPLAVLLMTNFDSFRDVADYDRQPVYLMKRAQICAMDLAIAFGLHNHPPLAGLDGLTAFADYRVPQALRHLGIVKFSEELAAKVEGEQELPAGSLEEIEIRAATIQAVDRMVQALRRNEKKGAAWEVDVFLWELSHAPEVRVKHHRTRTVYY